jgi:hypothetical protein
MLNLMWTSEGQPVVKEEQDTCSDPGSPLLLASLQDSHYSHPHQHSPYGLTVSLACPDPFYCPEPAESPQLELLQPLPSFNSLPSSPRKQAEFQVVSVHEFTAAALLDCSTALHSPDSSSSGGGGGAAGGQPVNLLPLPPPLQDSVLHRRKRSNSGSSGSSGTSSTSKAVKRRRPPISQEELMNQRNQGGCPLTIGVSLCCTFFFLKLQ